MSWLVEVGDAVNEGDELVELESSKIVNVLQAHAAGTLRRKVAKEGDTLPVGALLGVVSDPAVPEQEIESFISGFKPAATVISSEPAEVKKVAPASAAKTPAAAGGTGIPDKLKQGADDSALPASPHARRFAKEHGINLNNVTGSGRGGRIQIEDIERAVFAAGGSLPGAATATPAAAAAFEEIPMAGMRQTIAKRLKEAKLEAPHYRLVRDVNVGRLVQLRETLNKGRTDPVSLNDVLIKACAMTLVRMPACNIQFDGNTVRRYRDADIAVAVALDSGLITPIVQAANLKSVAEIAAAVRSLVEKAKAGTLKAADYTGGSFTVSNLGMYGVRQFDAIINRPQAAILAVGAAEERVVALNGAPAVARMLTLTLSCDHRVIDGAVGAAFLKALAELIENPDSLAA